MTTHLGALWDEALVYASHVHGGQVRNGSGEVPYVTHLLSVAGLVLEHGGTETEAVAALLHHAVEDQGGQRRLEDIGHRFGEGVAADIAARKFLGRHGSTVFLTPLRRLLVLPSYQLVQAAVAAEGLPGVSVQSYALRAKILEVDALARDTRLREVHPEVSFRAMNGNNDLRHGKKTRDGFAERTSLLPKNGVWISAEGLAVKGAGADDVLDAGAAAWSARRIANGTGRSLPGEPAGGEHGRPIAIWH
jgi:predicted RNase H-like nuclease